MINILKLKARLKEKNLTQEKAAKILNINASTLNKKLNDETGEYLTINEVTKLKDLLGISLSEVNSYFFIDLLEDTQVNENE